MEIAKLFNALPSAGSQGVIWGIMAIGVYITYRILDVADLTVDGSIATGGAVAAVLIIGGSTGAEQGGERLQRVGRDGRSVSGRHARRPRDGHFPHVHGHPGDSGGHFDPAFALFHQPAHPRRQGEYGGQRQQLSAARLRPQRARAVAFQPDLHSGGAGRRGDRAAVLVLRHGARLLPARNRRKRQHGARAGHQHQRG